MASLTSTHSDSLSRDHDAFLHRVASDPRFRTALEADPQAALAECGLHVDPEQVPSKVTIPSAESILDVLGEDADAEEKRSIFPWIPLLGM